MWGQAGRGSGDMKNSPGAGERASLPGHGNDRLAVLTPETRWALPGSVLAQTINHSFDHLCHMHQSITSILGTHNEQSRSVAADLQ